MKRFAHQEREWEHRYAEARALLWQPRTGKTRAVIESAVALHEALEIRGVLVVAPNGVHAQWAEEQIGRWGAGVTHGIHAWRFSDPNNDLKYKTFMLNTRQPWFHWLCVNTESIIRDEMREAIRQFKKAVGPAMLVVDESHHFGRPGAKRTGVVRGLARQFEYRRILTGTPTDESPLQAFSQFEIMRKEALGHRTFGSFKSEFAEYDMQGFGGRRFPKLRSYKNLERLRDRMAQYASVVLRSDCADLPEVMRVTRRVELTAKQLKWWNAVKKKLILELEDLGESKVFAGGAALVKLQQIEGGYFKREDGSLESLVPIRENPKMLVLLDEITQHDSQVIVWFAYVHEIRAAHEFLREIHGIDCVEYHGQMNQKQREVGLAEFKRGKHAVLLGQPAAGGEGRDMSAASKIVYFSHVPRAVVRGQSMERATKMGGDKVQLVDLLTPVGEYFLGLTDKKIALADDVSKTGLKGVLEGLHV